MRREVLKKVLNIALVALFVMVCSWLPAWAEKAPKDANSKANDKNVQKQPAAATTAAKKVKKAAKKDSRIIIVGKKHYINPAKFDYSDLLS